MKARKLLHKDNSFYKKYYQYFLYGVMVVTLLTVGLICLIVYQMLHRPLPTFYAKRPDQQKMNLTSYTSPNLLPDTILHWASKAATFAYSFDYVNYNAQLRAVRPYFTDAGWQMYLASVQSLIDAIVQKQLFVNGVVAGTPVIANQGDLPGRGFVWRIQIPFLVVYQSSSDTTTANYFVVLSLVRVPTSVNPQGIGIDQFVMAQ